MLIQGSVNKARIRFLLSRGLCIIFKATIFFFFFFQIIILNKQVMKEIYHSAFGIKSIRGINCTEACILEKSHFVFCYLSFLFLNA